MKESPVAGSLLSSLDVGDAAPSAHPNALCVSEVIHETKCDPYVSCGVGVTSKMGDSGAGVPFLCAKDGSGFSLLNCDHAHTEQG